MHKRSAIQAGHDTCMQQTTEDGWTNAQSNNNMLLIK